MNTHLLADVVEYCLEALDGASPNDELLLRKLFALLVSLCTEAREAFAIRTQHGGAEKLGRALEMVARAPCVGPETNLAALTFLNTTLGLVDAGSSSGFLGTCCESLTLFAAKVPADVEHPALEAWLSAAAAALFDQPQATPQAEKLAQMAGSMLRIVQAASEVPPRVIPAALKLGGCLGNSAGLDCLQYLVRTQHQVFAQHPRTAVEVFAFVDRLAEPPRDAFASCFSHFFEARKRLSLQDPVLLEWAARLLSIAKKVAPWLLGSAVGDSNTLLTMADPEAWPDRVSAGCPSAERQMIIGLLSCCAGCGYEPLTPTASHSMKSVASVQTLLHSPASALATAILLTCSAQGSAAAVSNDAVRGALVNGLLAARPRLWEGLPQPFLSWLFSVPALEPLVAEFVQALVRRSADQALASLGHLGVAPMVKLLSQLEYQVQAMHMIRNTLQRGPDQLALYLTRGLVGALQAMPMTPQSEKTLLCATLRIALLVLTPDTHVACASIVARIAECMPAEPGCSSEMHLDWLNCALALEVLSPMPWLPAWATVGSDWRNVPPPILVGQLQLTALAAPRPQVVRLAIEIATDTALASDPVITSACLFLMRRSLERCGLSEALDAQTLDFAWAYLVSLMASPQEMVRLAAAKCALSLLRAHGGSAPTLVAKPWALFSCRAAVAKLVSAPLDTRALPKSYLVYVAALVCGTREDGRSEFLGPMLPASLIARLVPECASSERSDLIALELLHALCNIHAPDEATVASLKHVVQTKLDRLATSTDDQGRVALHHADYHGMRMIPSLLWDGGETPALQAREDLLFRLRAKLHTTAPSAQ